MSDDESVDQVAGREAPRVEVNPAVFEDVSGTEVAADPAQSPGAGNLDLIMDVTVPVNVSVGSVRKSISEILALGPGHVVDLERLAGDPVDLLVNGKLIARGEVVVVDDRYGMRITEIMTPRERLSRVASRA
jgi:flagellar motor switch protein FliN/FliY